MRKGTAFGVVERACSLLASFLVGPIGILLAATCLVCTPAWAQCDERWLSGGDWPGVGGQVYAVAALPSGRLVVGGNFGQAGTLAVNHIAMYDPATLTWSGLGSGMNGRVRSLLALPNGDVIVGGEFTTAGGAPANHVARYSPTTGTWSTLGSGVTGTSGAASSFIYGMGLLLNGDIAVTGSFSNAGGVSARGVAIYSQGSGAWSPLGLGLSSYGNSVAILQDGSLVVGGNFTAAGGVAANHIARYQPGTGEWSAMGAGLNLGGTTFFVRSDGRLIVGGLFTNAGGVPANRIAVYDPAGGTWSTMGAGLNGPVSGVCGLSNGDVMAVGTFTQAGNQSSNFVARFHADTGEWTSVRGGLSVASDYAYTVFATSSEDVIVGGSYSRIGNKTAHSIARYNSDTGDWGALGRDGVDGSIQAFANIGGGDMIIGGAFTAAGTDPSYRIARYHSTSGTWSPIAIGVGGGQESTYVDALQVLPNGDVLVGGYFDSAGGVAAGGVVRYSPATETWSSLPGSPNGVTGTVTSFGLMPNGDYILGGTFYSAGGVSAAGVARFSPATGTWSSMGANLTGSLGAAKVNAIGISLDGDVIIGGRISTVAGAQIQSVARFHSATGAWSALGAGVSSPFDSDVNAIAVLHEGKMCIGGKFTTSGGLTLNHVGMYDPTTDSWSALAGGVNDTVTTILALEDGRILVSGVFTAAGNIAANGIAIYDPVMNSWSSLGSGRDNATVYALAQASNGDVLFGGGFNSIGGQQAANLGRYTFGQTPLQILTQPESQEVCEGNSVVLSVEGVGSGPLVFQWRKDGIAIPSWGVERNPTSNMASLQILSTRHVDSGSYDCIVTDACGEVHSESSMLVVHPAQDHICCDADLNQDGVADQGDVDYLINVVAGAANPTGIQPDFNHDGASDQGDIDALIAVIAGGSCP